MEKMREKRLIQLQDLCREFGMRDYVKNKKKPKEKELFTSLVYGFDNSFQAYKKNSNIDKTLIYCKLKEKEKTRGQKQLENTVTECKEEYQKEKVKKRRAAAGIVKSKNFWIARNLNRGGD